MKTLKHKIFEIENGVLINGDYAFKTREDANQYAKLKCEWWGSNLIYLGAEEKNGLFYCGFNVWN
jgi:hypothetical protein